MTPVRAGQRDSRQANVPACWSHAAVARSLRTAACSVSRLIARETRVGPGPSSRALRWSVPHRPRLLQGCDFGGAGQRRVPAPPCECCGRWIPLRLWARDAQWRVLPWLQAAHLLLPGIIGGEAVRARLIARSNSLARFVSCCTRVSLGDRARSLPSIPRPRANGIICRPSLRRARAAALREGNCGQFFGSPIPTRVQSFGNRFVGGGRVARLSLPSCRNAAL